MQNLKRSFHILLNSKLVWVLSFLLLLSSFLFSSFPTIFQILRYPIWVIGLYLILVLATSIVYAVTNGSLIYVIYQASLSKTLSISEAWFKGKLRLSRILGVLFLWLAIPLLAGLVSLLIRSTITIREVTIPLMAILDLVSNVFYNPYLILILCAVMVDNLRVLPATRTGFLITLNNFFLLLMVMTVIALIHFLVDWLLLVFLAPGIANTEMVIQSFLTNGGLKNLMAIPPFNIAHEIILLIETPWMYVFFTLGYLKFTEKVA